MHHNIRNWLDAARSVVLGDFLYIDLAESCDDDKLRILATTAEALTHVNAHSEASRVREILSDLSGSTQG